MKKLIVIISLLLTFTIFTKNTYADDKFLNSYRITYKINNSGLMDISEQITIQNKVSDYYPTSQTFSYQSLNMGNIKVIDENGEFEPEIEKKDNKTFIKVNFRTKNPGIGKQTKFTLTYQTTDLATLNGEVWQILIPGIKNLDKYDNFDLDLIIPETFPEIQYVYPEPETKWHWNKQTMKEKGIFLIFGKNQYYKFNLTYELENFGIAPIQDSITIPPDTNYQQVILEDINPKPIFSEKDDDGNWIFWYELKGKEKLNIKSTVYINLKFDPDQSEALSKKQIEKYTSSQKYWNYEDFNDNIETIKQLNDVKEIYDFTVNTLTYNFNRLNQVPKRYTAKEALNNPINSICTDFTNVFISLARKNKIPTREINGYAFAQNSELQPSSLEKDILHAWPEYFDYQKQKWIMVDPTWEKTTGGIDFFNKLDLNHVTFVIKGISSEKPLPAGSYKTSSKNSKQIKEEVINENVFRNIAKSELSSNQIVDLIYDMENEYISGLNASGRILVQNKNKVAISNVQVNYRISDKSQTKTIKHLIPYEISEFSFDFPKTNFWETRSLKITTEINGKKYTEEIIFTPIFLWKNNIYVFGSGMILIFLFTIIYVVLRVKMRQK